MANFISIVGGILLITLCLVLLACMYFLACAFTKHALEKLTWKIEQSERAKIHNQMLRDAWWFGEMREVTTALQIYAKAIVSYDSIDNARKEWRDYLAKSKPNAKEGEKDE